MKFQKISPTKFLLTVMMLTNFTQSNCLVVYGGESRNTCLEEKKKLERQERERSLCRKIAELEKTNRRLRRKNKRLQRNKKK